MVDVRDRKEKGLTLQDVPLPEADWSEIAAFARSFDAPAYHGSYRACVEIGRQRRHETLEDLRTCLYFEERRWRQCALIGIEMGEEDMEYIRQLVRMIRQRLGKGSRSDLAPEKVVGISGAGRWYSLIKEAGIGK